MMSINDFQYERFVALSDSDLYAYVEPFLDPRILIPQDVLQRMLSELPMYDECHLVYAIELGPDRVPELFASVVPQYLSHKSQSVRCAASRALNRLPDRFMTRSLLDAVRNALSSCPEREKETWAIFLEDLQRRTRSGHE